MARKTREQNKTCLHVWEYCVCAEDEDSAGIAGWVPFD